MDNFVNHKRSYDIQLMNSNKKNSRFVGKVGIVLRLFK